MNNFKKFTIVFIALISMAATVGSVLYANKVIGIYSQQNFIENADFEKNTYGVSKSGAGSTAFDISANTGIYGNALRITTPQANDSILFALDSNIATRLSGLNCEARYNLKLGATPIVPTVVTVNVVRNAGSVVVSNTQTITLSTDSIWYPISVNFPCSTILSATNLRLNIITAGTTGVGTPEIFVDNLYAGEATNITNQVVVTDWIPYTPTITSSSGTLTNFTLSETEYMRDGPNLYIKGVLTFTGAPGTWGFPRISLPPGLTTAATASSYAMNTIVLTDLGTNTYGGDAVYIGGVDYIRLQSMRGTSGAGIQLSSTSPFTWASGDSISWQIGPIKVSQFSVTQSAITQQCIQDGSCENMFSAYVSATGVVTSENLDWIEGNCTNASPRVCTLKASMFGASPNCTISHAGTAQYFGSVSTSSTQLVIQTWLDNGSVNAQPATVVCQRSANDYKPRFTAPVLVGSVTSNSQSALRIEAFTVNNTNGSNSVLSQSATGTFSTTGSCNGTGDCSYNITPAFSSANYWCSASPGFSTGATSANVDVVSSSQLRLITYLGTTPANSSKVTIICIGPR